MQWFGGHFLDFMRNKYAIFVALNIIRRGFLSSHGFLDLKIFYVASLWCQSQCPWNDRDAHLTARYCHSVYLTRLLGKVPQDEGFLPFLHFRSHLAHQADFRKNTLQSAVEKLMIYRCIQIYSFAQFSGGIYNGLKANSVQYLNTAATWQMSRCLSILSRIPPIKTFTTWHCITM